MLEWRGGADRVAIDTHDREIVAWTDSRTAFGGIAVRDLMRLAVERRFGGLRTRYPVEWLLLEGGDGRGALAVTDVRAAGHALQGGEKMAKSAYATRSTCVLKAPCAGMPLTRAYPAKECCAASGQGFAAPCVLDLMQKPCSETEPRCQAVGPFPARFPRQGGEEAK